MDFSCSPGRSKTDRTTSVSRLVGEPGFNVAENIERAVPEPATIIRESNRGH